MPTSLDTPLATTPSFDAHQLAASVRHAQRIYGAAAAAHRDAVLIRLGELLEQRRDQILEANQRDLKQAAADRLSGPLLDRLELTTDKLATLISGVAQLAAQIDPVGRPIRRTLLDDGLLLEQVKSPLGVLLVIFESRPDAVIQIGSLALRAGAGVILKGGSEAKASNHVLVDCLRAALTAHDLPADVVVGVDGRRAVSALLAEDHSIDLVIPRGSGELVRTIQNSTRIPVLGHAEGVCHLYLDASADPHMASHLAVDGKCSYPSACNATETLLVHRDFLPHLGMVAKALRDAGVELRCDPAARAVLPWSLAANDADWRAEYGDLTLAVRVVESLESAVEHIHTHGSAHTEAIVTQDQAAADAFLRRVDAASVFHNASTRFADGYRYGLGAEIGVATGRLHARGPVGIDGLLTSRWLLRGQGQAASDYGPGKGTFLHRHL